MNEDRMSMNPDDLKIKDKNGNYIKGEEARNYLKEQKEKMLKVKEEIQKGEIVKLQRTGRILKVIENDGDVFKYSGSNLNMKGPIILFNQEDIEKIIEKEENKNYKKL